MSTGITIDVAEIKNLTNRLFDLLESQGKTGIKIDNALYWTVFPDNIFSADQPDLVMGDIEDDMGDAQADLAPDNQDVVAIWHPAHHLAALIQLIAYADMNDRFVSTDIGRV